MNHLIIQYYHNYSQSFALKPYLKQMFVNYPNNHLNSNDKYSSNFYYQKEQYDHANQDNCFSRYKKLYSNK